VILTPTAPYTEDWTLSSATLPFTLRQVTGPLKRVPQSTWPVGFSPFGPLRASTSTGPLQPGMLDVPLPVTESPAGAWALETPGRAVAAPTPATAKMNSALLNIVGALFDRSRSRMAYHHARGRVNVQM
jgi:hypothetical protein